MPKFEKNDFVVSLRSQRLSDGSLAFHVSVEQEFRSEPLVFYFQDEKTASDFVMSFQNIRGLCQTVKCEH